MEAQAYLFDMDGVLVDNCRYHVLSWLEFAKRYGCPLTERQIIDWMGAPGRDYIVRMFGERSLPASMEELLSEKETLYRELFRPHLEARKGLVALLERAQAKGVVCAVATGGPLANVDFVLDGLGLRGYFSCVVDSSQYVRGKPAPDCYLQSASKLAVAPQDCIVFEDAVNGVEAAHAAGMRVIAITGTNPRETLEAAGADEVVDSFDEVKLQ